jgi:hypothetical protein
MGDQRQRWQDALGHALPDLLRANPDVNAPLDFLARKLGIDENVALITGLTVRQSPSIRSRPYMRI